MSVEMEAGLLGTLAAVWNADGLEAWSAKLVGLLVAVLLAAAIFSLRQRKAGRAKVATGAGLSAGRPSRRNRTVPPKNLKKKQPRPLRRYKPRSHSGTLRPLRRRPAALTLAASGTGLAKLPPRRAAQ